MPLEGPGQACTMRGCDYPECLSNEGHCARLLDASEEAEMLRERLRLAYRDRDTAQEEVDTLEHALAEMERTGVLADG